MSVDIAKINEINKRILEYNKKIEAAEAKREVYIANLKKACEKVKEQTGTDVWCDGNIEKIKSVVGDMLSDIETKLEEEIALKEKLLNAAENENFEEFNSLLGIKKEADVIDVDDVVEALYEEPVEVSKEVPTEPDNDVVEDLDIIEESKDSLEEFKGIDVDDLFSDLDEL